MSVKTWRGGAAAVTDVWTLVVTASAASGTITVTINGKSVVYTSADTSTTTTAAGLQAALSSSAEPEFQEFVYTVNGSTVTMTAQTAGVPIGPPSKADAGGDTSTLTHTATATGPNWFNNGANWDPVNNPVTGDSINFTNASQVPVLYGLDALAITGVQITTEGYVGQIGLPDRNQSGYTEYRPRRLKLDATSVTIGLGDPPGAGPTRFRYDANSSTPAITVLTTGAPADAGVDWAVEVVGTNPTPTLNWNGGTVAVAPAPGDSCSAMTIRGAAGDRTSATLRLGLGMSAGSTLDIAGGTTTTFVNVAATTLEAGTLKLLGGAGITATVNVNGGELVKISSGTLAGGNVRAGGTLDLSGDQRTNTIGTFTVYAGGTLDDSRNTIAASTVISTPDGIENCTIKSGRGASFTKN